MSNELRPPVALRNLREVEIHGHKLQDYYYWLRKKKNPQVIKYLEEENAYTEDRMEMTDLSVPYLDGPYYYYTRTVDGLQYPIHCRKLGSLDAQEEIVLDENVLAEGLSFSGIGVADVSPCHKFLAYSHDDCGEEEFILYVRDLTTGEDIETIEIEETYYSFAWAADSKSFFFVTTDDSHRPYRVHRYDMATDEETIVYQEDDERFYVSVALSDDKKFIFIESGSGITSETLVIPADSSGTSPRVLIPRVHDVLYKVEHQTDRFLVLTNKDGAKNFKLMSISDESVPILRIV